MAKNKSGYVQIDPLFGGLTRPPMVFGVTYAYFALNILGSLVYFILRSDFKVILIAAFVHGIAYMVCLKEPLLIEMFMLRQAKFRRCRNRKVHGLRNSYDFY